MPFAELKKQIAEAEREPGKNARWLGGRNSSPALIFRGTAERPSSISVYGISGGADRWLKIPLELSQPPVTYAAQSLAIVRRKPHVTFFGTTTGFIVNYAPDFAFRFDIKGKPVEV